MEKDQKIHNYEVLNEIFGKLENDYAKLRVEFDNLIKYLYDNKINKEEKAKKLSNIAVSLNFMTHYINLGFDLLKTPMHPPDCRHILIRYRHFGEDNISDFFLLLKALQFKKGDLKFDSETFTVAWANLMTQIDMTISELLENTLIKIHHQLIDRDVAEKYYEEQTIEIGKRKNIYDML